MSDENTSKAAARRPLVPGLFCSVPFQLSSSDPRKFGSKGRGPCCTGLDPGPEMYPVSQGCAANVLFRNGCIRPLLRRNVGDKAMPSPSKVRRPVAPIFGSKGSGVGFLNRGLLNFMGRRVGSGTKASSHCPYYLCHYAKWSVSVCR